MATSTKKLYKVTLQAGLGTPETTPTNRYWGISYILANNHTAAVDIVKNSLEKRKIGTEYSRSFVSVELIADQPTENRAGSINITENLYLE